MADFYWRQGDTASPFQEILGDDDGNPVDIEGATIHLTMTPIRGGTPIIDSDADNLQNGDGSDGTKGTISYQPATGETDVPGDLLASIKVTFADGKVQTYPNSGYILVTITPTPPIDTLGVGRYLSVEELKKTLGLTGQTFADEDILIAIEAAARGLEEAYSSFWTKGDDGEQRFYTASTDRIVSLGDVLAISAVDLDYSFYDVYTDGGDDDDWFGGGTYSVSLQRTDYRLLPLPQQGAGLVADGGRGEPYRELHLARGAQYLSLPRGTDAIRITGTFGWETVPAGVRSATSILATRFLRRAREAPWGIVAIGLEGAVVRIREMTKDPEILFAMNALGRTRSLIV